MRAVRLYLAALAAAAVVAVAAAVAACACAMAPPAPWALVALLAPRGRLALPALLLRQYMHNTENAVTMRLSTILKTIKQPL